MSPDGAEAVLANGRYVRSVPRDERPARAHAYWRCDDVDGDGLALTMRVRDPGGEMVESPEFPGLLLPRTIDDPPPYYKVYPEGVIENFDGSNVPTPHFLSDNQTDLNRNFPFFWAPDSKQEGAGAFPLSEVESRAVVEFAIAASRDLPLAQPAHVRRRVHPAAGRQARHQDEPGGPRALSPARRLGRGAHRLSDGVGLRGVSLRARHAAARRSHRLRLSPARRRRLRRRAVGPLQAGRLRAQEALRRQLHAVDARGHAARSPSGTATRTPAAWCARGARSSIRSWATSRSAASIRASGCGIRRPRRCRGVCTAQAAHYLRAAALAPAVVRGRGRDRERCRRS